MLAHNHFHLDTTCEDYSIEDMTSKNDSKMERHQVAHKVKSL